jgi:hypothetical protein
MTNCDNCDKTLGIFAVSSDFEDEEGNALFFCKSCDEDYIEKQDKETKREETKRLKSILQKNSKWEYKLLNLKTVGSGLNATGNKIKEKDVEKLNELGLKGWELISATTMNSFAARIGASSTAKEWVSCIFKRKI